MERRAWIRFACDLEVTCRSAGPIRDVGWPGKVANISAGGLGLLLPHRFERGIELAIEIMKGTGIRRTVIARVAHVTPVLTSGNPVWLIGCAFAEPLTEGELKAIQ
jgi:hypothetical protein